MVNNTFSYRGYCNSIRTKIKLAHSIVAVAYLFWHMEQDCLFGRAIITIARFQAICVRFEFREFPNVTVDMKSVFSMTLRPKSAKQKHDKKTCLLKIKVSFLATQRAIFDYFVICVDNLDFQLIDAKSW